MSGFDQMLLQYFTKQQLLKIASARVLIIGAGGLGSNISNYLVRSGFQRLTIVDFDTVERSNLNRQFYFERQIGKPKVQMLEENLRSIRPELSLGVIQDTVTRENIGALIKAHDITVEAVDVAKTKKMITEAALLAGKILVGASGMAGIRGIDQIKIHQVFDRIYIVGDLTSGVSQDSPPLAPKVNIVAAKQAAAVLELTLFGECEAAHE